MNNVMMLEQIEYTIEWLKSLGFEPFNCGAMWICGSNRFSGYGDSELLAWCDLVLDNEIMFDIAKEYCRE